MSQPQPRQQHEFPDIQMLQRHIMFKQLQELQRQRQLQQIGDMRQQNYINQVSLFNKQTSGIQLPPPIVNGTPIRDTSQIFSAGNIQLMQRGSSTVDHGFPNGPIFSQVQSQAASPMGVLPHQLNASMYGGPVVGTGNNLNPYSALQGLSNDTTSILTNSNNNQLELPMFQHATFNNSFMSGQSNASSSDSGHVFMPDIAPVPKQVFQERDFFGQVPIQNLDGLLVGNLNQVSALPSKSSMQDSCGSREQVSWSGLSAPKLPNMGNSQSSCSLDPLEQKILFNTDDNWESNSGQHGNLGISGFGSALGNSDCMSSFPSLQSGSWSALMQSAVGEASSSDTGLQEEWSGLSFQNPELSTENQPSNYVDSGRQQTNWIDNNLQNASSPSSKPELLNQNYSMNCNFQGLQQLNHQYPGQKEEIHSDSAQYAGKWLDCSPRQKQPLKESQLVQTASPARNFWPIQHHEHTETHLLNVDSGRSHSNLTGQFSDLVRGLNEGKSGEVNTEVNEVKSPLNTITPVPDKSTADVRQIVDHETNQHLMNSTHNIIIERTGSHHLPRADCLGKENYLESNQSNVGHGLRGKLWHHGTTQLPIVHSRQKPSNQASQVLSGSEQSHLGQYNSNVSNIIMASEQVQLPLHPSNSIPRGDNDGPMPTLLDTSCFQGKTVTADTRKHLLNQFHTDGKIVEHGTEAHFNCKEFVQSSEKSQMKASLESLPMLYNQLQNQNLPLHVASHSPQAMFAGQATTPSLTIGISQGVSHATPANHRDQEFPAMPISKLSVISNVNQQAGHSMLSDIPAQQHQFQLGFHKVLSNLLQPTASTTSSLEHTTKNTEEQHNQSSFGEGNESEATDSSLRKSQGFDSKQGGQNKHYPPTPSARDLEIFGHSLRPSQGHHQNQVQSLMNAENDVDKMSGKYMGSRNMENSEVNAERYNLLSPQEYNVLNSSSETREDRFNEEFPQTSVQDDSQMVMLGWPNQTVSASMANKVEEGKINLQMAPPWFKHHGNSKNGHILSMLAAKNSSQQLIVGKPLDNLQLSSSILRGNSSNASKGSHVWPTTSTVSVVGTHSSNSYELPLDVSDQNLAIRKSKKRKLGSFCSLPWHKEVNQGSLECPNISMAELEWCVASNRSQKVENEVELVRDLAPIYRSKRRLTKTTQLMQQILRPAPAVIVSANAFSNCDSVVYFIARLALGDACNMTCGFHMQFTAGNMSSDKVESPGTLHGKDFLKTVENLVCRAKGLEDDFIRLEKRASILDLKIESQELEKFSIINRFARFHNRGQIGAVGTSSVSTPAVLKSAPQRYIMVSPMPKAVPDGVNCLSL